MPALSSTLRPNPISVPSAATRRLLGNDLLTPYTPYTPVTPSSSTAMSPSAGTPILSAPPTPTASSTGRGVVVRMSDGRLAIRTVRKILRIEEKDERTTKEIKEREARVGSGTDAVDEKKPAKQADADLQEGDEVDFRTDGSKAFDVKKVMMMEA